MMYALKVPRTLMHGSEPQWLSHALVPITDDTPISAEGIAGVSRSIAITSHYAVAYMTACNVRVARS
jgi:hypothetical protein